MIFLHTLQLNTIGSVGEGKVQMEGVDCHLSACAGKERQEPGKHFDDCSMPDMVNPQ